MKTPFDLRQQCKLSRKNKQSGRERTFLFHAWKRMKSPFWRMKGCHGHGVHTCYSVYFPLWTPSQQQSCSEQKTPPILLATIVSSPQDWINPISTFSVIISSQVSFNNASTWQVFKSPCHVLEGQNPSSDVKGWGIYISTKRHKITAMLMINSVF